MKKIISILFSVLILVSCFSVLSFAADESDKPFENSEFFVSDDYTLHYRVFEPSENPKKQIFLIHGFCLSTVSFENIAQEYVKMGCRVVLADMPNFGYSSRETKSSSLKDREELSYELMMNLSTEPWIVGGNSMGGGIAINIATDHPESVNGLILFAPQTSTEMAAPMNMIMRSGLVQTIYTILVKFALMNKSLIRNLVEDSFSDKEYAANYDLNRITDPFKINGTGAGIAIMASHARGTDFEKFSSLDIPTVIIAGEDDRIANKDNLDKIIDNAPKGAEVYRVDFGGHMMMEYDAEKTAALTVCVIEK